MKREPFSRLDRSPELRQKILPYCRLKTGDIWQDPQSGHRIGVLDATKTNDVMNVFQGEHAALAIQDPPYNVIVGNENTSNLFKMNLQEYMRFSQQWVENTLAILSKDASMYIWLGADQKDHFQPLPDFMLMMRAYPDLRSRSLITMRNQRGYGTQKNWMAVRQECLYYIKGDAYFDVHAEYTDIPKILRGYLRRLTGRSRKTSSEAALKIFGREMCGWMSSRYFTGCRRMFRVVTRKNRSKRLSGSWRRAVERGM